MRIVPSTHEKVVTVHRSGLKRRIQVQATSRSIPTIADMLALDADGPDRLGTAHATPDDGKRVDVKSARYLQRWRQWKPSVIRFGSFTGRRWDPHTEYFAEGRSIRADVFVFAVQTALDPTQYDPFDVEQWGFYVIGAPKIAAYGYRSANLAWVQRVAESPVDYKDLSAAVHDAFDEGGRSYLRALDPDAAAPSGDGDRRCRDAGETAVHRHVIGRS